MYQFLGSLIYFFYFFFFFFFFGGERGAGGPNWDKGEGEISTVLFFLFISVFWAGYG